MLWKLIWLYQIQNVKQSSCHDHITISLNFLTSCRLLNMTNWQQDSFIINNSVWPLGVTKTTKSYLIFDYCNFWICGSIETFILTFMKCYQLTIVVQVPTDDIFSRPRWSGMFFSVHWATHSPCIPCIHQLTHRSHRPCCSMGAKYNIFKNSVTWQRNNFGVDWQNKPKLVFPIFVKIAYGTYVI